MFANTPKGAQGNAVLFSLIETAKENGLDPYRFLSNVFDAVPNMNLGDPKQLEQLLPWNALEMCKVLPGLNEDGVYKGELLSDEAFLELIRKQFLDVVDISDERFL